MNWLRGLVAGIFDAVFGWGQKQSEKPKVTNDANTPKKVRDDLNKSVDDWMRDQDQHRD